MITIEKLRRNIERNCREVATTGIYVIETAIMYATDVAGPALFAIRIEEIPKRIKYASIDI